MHICRFTRNDDPAQAPRLGLMEGDIIRDVTAATQSLPNMRWPLPAGDQFIAHLPQMREAITALAALAPSISRNAVKLLSPIANVGKFICGAGNWQHHGAPLGTMGFMFKASSANAGEGEGVQICWPNRTTLHEPELAIIIGQTCRNVSVKDALDYVAGYTCALDMTLKRVSEDYAFCKSFDSYGILGPCLVTADEVPDPCALTYQFWVNDELRGARKFADLTGSPAELVAFASSAMTLYPGDVILSGAADVGPVAIGDIMRLEISMLGGITVPVTLSRHAR